MMAEDANVQNLQLSAGSIMSEHKDVLGKVCAGSCEVEDQ